MQFLLHLESFKKFLQVGDEVDDGGDDEDSDEETTGPVTRGKVTISNCAHGYHDKVVDLEEGEIVVNAKEVVKYT